MGIQDVLPALGLRIAVTSPAGDLVLAGITDDLLAELAEVAKAGIHDPERMPFTFPWTDTAPERFALQFAQYHWGTRASWSPEKWDLNLAVLQDGRPIGVQGFSTSDYLVTRVGETGSWLGQVHQGRGVGTIMRRAICAFLFDHLDAVRITSGYFSDNPGSGAVSRKVGYRENGTERRQRRPGELATLTLLTLDPDDFDRGGVEIEVEGLAPFRRSVGLE
jgi:RimJ/RimL family protein N-acetyltransferase